MDSKHGWDKAEGGARRPKIIKNAKQQETDQSKCKTTFTVWKVLWMGGKKILFSYITILVIVVIY